MKVSEGNQYLGMSYDYLISINDIYKDIFVPLLHKDGIELGAIVSLKARSHVGKTVFHMPAESIWLGIDFPF